MDTVLVAPAYSKSFILYTDSSEHSVDACLTQRYGEHERPIAFASAKLSAVQCRWSVIERESYSVIFG